MAAEKKPARARAPSAAHDFTIVLEKIHGDMQVFGEGLQALRAHVDAGFAKVDERFEQVDRRFDAIDRRFEGVDREIGLVKAAVLTHDRELRATRSDIQENKATLARVEEKLDKKVDRDEIEPIVERLLARR
jgi:septal ring factor EnvC (AmiA/AmiB activator)